MKKTAMLLTACLLAASCMTIHAEEPFHRSITVTGTGTVTAKNDMATVNLSVQTMARDAKVAARDNADIMTAVYIIRIGRIRFPVGVRCMLGNCAVINETDLFIIP